MGKTNFIEKFINITGLNKEEALKLINTQKKSVLVLNTLKADKNLLEEIANDEDLQELPTYKDVYLITSDKSKLTRSPNFKDGYYYIQNLSSLLPVLALKPQEDDLILDLCAAPGGKSFNICRLTHNKAHISVNETEKHRLNDLLAVKNIYGLEFENVFQEPGQGLYRLLNTRFDKILLDAPCSAEGLITNLAKENPQFWSQKKVKQLRNLQKKLINSAYHMLKPGGTLVYSTCTYSPEENEEVVNWLLTEYNDIAVEELTELPQEQNFVPGLQKWENKVFDKAVTKTIRVLPTDKFEGFFVAKLRKSANNV